MVVQADQDRMKQLLSEALPMLCRSGLSFSSQFCVEALIGITLDKNDVMLVSIKETIKSEGAEDSEPEKSVEVNISKVPSDAAGSGRKPHRKRRRSKSKNQEESSDSETNEMPDGQTAMKREKMDNSTLESASDFDNTNTSIPYGSSEHGESKHNVDDDNDSHDAVIVKEEPGDFSSVSFGDMNSSHNYDPDQSHEMLANQTFPGTSYGSNAPSIIVPNAATNQNQLANTSLEEQTSSWRRAHLPRITKPASTDRPNKRSAGSSLYRNARDLSEEEIEARRAAWRKSKQAERARERDKYLKKKALIPVDEKEIAAEKYIQELKGDKKLRELTVEEKRAYNRERKRMQRIKEKLKKKSPTSLGASSQVDEYAVIKAEQDNLDIVELFQNLNQTEANLNDTSEACLSVQDNKDPQH